VAGTASWYQSGPGVLSLSFSFATPEPSLADIRRIKIFLPGGRTITSFTAPPSLSDCTTSGTELRCTGSLRLGARETLQVRTSPAPVAGMGGTLFGTRGGKTFGPFPISGPTAYAGTPTPAPHSGGAAGDVGKAAKGAVGAAKGTVKKVGQAAQGAGRSGG
jgi:hypothetical protein